VTLPPSTMGNANATHIRSLTIQAPTINVQSWYTLFSQMMNHQPEPICMADDLPLEKQRKLIGHWKSIHRQIRSNLICPEHLQERWDWINMYVTVEGTQTYQNWQKEKIRNQNLELKRQRRELKRALNMKEVYVPHTHGPVQSPNARKKW